MLVQFKVENFLSFKDPATLSMLASKRRSKNKSLDTNATFDAAKGIKLLKCATVYGANASGKSNLFSAIKFMRRFVIESSKNYQADDTIPVEPYKLSSDVDGKPSKFEIIFVNSGFLYQYEFAADASVIHEERLIQLNEETGDERELFSRQGSHYSINEAFSEGEGLQSKTRKNALFLSVCANFDGNISTEIIRWFRNLRVIYGLSDIGYLNFTMKLMEDEKNAKKIISLLKDFDLNIEKFESHTVTQHFDFKGDVPDDIRPLAEALKNMKDAKVRKLTTYHRKFDGDGAQLGEVKFDLDSDESEGTQKLVALAGPLVKTLENSYVLFIDEFDARLHPVLTKNIIKLFNCSQVNSHNAQLIVATHDTNLLDRDILRRDQVWFVERDYYGASHLASLVEYKGVRNDASYEKDYIAGKYGAIPILGDIRRIFAKSDIANK